MKFDIIATDSFEKHLKRLAKKYKSLKKDLAVIFASLEDEPEQGTYLGKDCYKIRIAISDKRKGKSGGGRVITCVKVIDQNVFLVALYDKSEKDDLDDNELDSLLKQAGLI